MYPPNRADLVKIRLNLPDPICVQPHLPSADKTFPGAFRLCFSVLSPILLKETQTPLVLGSRQDNPLRASLLVPLLSPLAADFFLPAVLLHRGFFKGGMWVFQEACAKRLVFIFRPQFHTAVRGAMFVRNGAVTRAPSRGCDITFFVKGRPTKIYATIA